MGKACRISTAKKWGKTSLASVEPSGRRGCDLALARGGLHAGLTPRLSPGPGNSQGWATKDRCAQCRRSAKCSPPNDYEGFAVHRAGGNSHDTKAEATCRVNNMATW